MKIKPRPPARMVLAGNLWSLVDHPTHRSEWTLSTKFRALADAGFDAVATRAKPEHKVLADKHGLRIAGIFSSAKAAEFAGFMSAQRDVGAEIINVQIGDDFTPVAEATDLAVALIRESEKQGIYTSIEAHRDTATETPEKLYAIADGYRRVTGKLLPITWDHSHIALVKHLKPDNYSRVLLARPDLIAAARYFHCRPFNGHHCQVPVFNARRRLTREFNEWLAFVRELFKCWLEGPRPGNELWVCPEIGPEAVHGYNLSTMPSSWEQAVVCKRELDRLWKSLGGVR